MSYRIFVSKWVPLYVMAVLLLAALPFVGQTPTAATKKATVTKGYTAPRTPDGKPDLQGVWNSATLTPLTRPKEFANKEFFTPEEAAAFEKSELQSVDADRRDGGAAADIGRAYNEFWRDRGKVSPELRTSLVIDPPDGKIPPLTPQGQKLAAQRRDQNKGKQFDGPENRSLAERCISVRNAGPPMIPTNYNSNYQIVQTPGRVALLSEQIHDLRIIRTHRRRRTSQAALESHILFAVRFICNRRSHTRPSCLYFVQNLALVGRHRAEASVVDHLEHQVACGGRGAAANPAAAVDPPRELLVHGVPGFERPAHTFRGGRTYCWTID